MTVPAPTHDTAPVTLADVLVNELKVYRLAVAARLLDLHQETLLRHGIKTLPRRFPNSAHRVFGHEILRLAGMREIDRAARTSEGNETAAERQKRVDADLARLRASTKSK